MSGVSLESILQKIQKILKDFNHIPSGWLPIGKNAWLQEWREKENELREVEGLLRQHQKDSKVVVDVLNQFELVLNGQVAIDVPEVKQRVLNGIRFAQKVLGGVEEK
jgi:hypothetical protein